jgi:hypothetical protein
MTPSLQKSLEGGCCLQFMLELSSLVVAASLLLVSFFVVLHWKSERAVLSVERYLVTQSIRVSQSVVVGLGGDCTAYE